MTLREYRVIGPPGTGKTTWLRDQVQRVVERKGPNSVLVTSFTVAAAKEALSRDLPIADERVGTLHALCYRALGRPIIAEGKAAEWNQAYPSLAISKTKGSLDEPSSELAGNGQGDELLMNVGRLRAKMVPVNLWPDQERAFASRWNDWKRQAGYADFTDLLEMGLQELQEPPLGADVLMADEAQDLTPLQWALVRQWGSHCEYLYVVGDLDQLIFDFTGASVESMLVPVHDEKTLDYSYRCPKAVVDNAVRWIEQASRRAPTVYRPRTGDDGYVRHEPLVNWQRPGALVEQIITRPTGETIMILASCSYMLQPLIAALRQEGLPYHNPYRQCSPPDEPVLTSVGWVPIGDLDPREHRLAGFYAKTNALSWGPYWDKDGQKRRKSGPNAKGKRGFAFSALRQPYAGDLITITTERSKTRVTPTHRVRVRWSDSFLGKWCVYLMRRKNWWRVGMAKTIVRASHIAGIGNRLSTEKADAAWVMGIYDTRTEAIRAEVIAQARYGLTGLTFTAIKRFPNSLSESELSAVHNELRGSSELRAHAFLAALGYDERWPHFVRDGRRDRRGSSSAAFETVAANVVSGYMMMPIPPSGFFSPQSARIAPEWGLLYACREQYEGDVFSLDVPGPEHYVSGGAIVHNSRGDWNPLRHGKGVSMVDRLQAFLRPSIKLFGDRARFWSLGDVQQFTAIMQSAAGLKRGAKTLLDGLEPERLREEADVSWLLEHVFEQAAFERVFDSDLDWWLRSLQKGKRDMLDYPLKVLEHRGWEALHREPELTIGTVHSVKGGESHHVVLFPDLSPAGYRAWQAVGPARDSVLRQFYVGLTRARIGVTLCAPAGPLSVPLREAG